MKLPIVLVLALWGCGPTERPVVPERFGTETPPYNRDEWGRWVDADRDCQDTRQEVLVAEGEAVTFVDLAKPCRVATGRWTCPYTGTVVTSPSELEIDHVVSLEEAHLLGGWAWPIEKKRAYYNDLDNPLHLVAATVSANRSKGSRPPTEWLPSDATKRCGYLKARVSVLEKWGLYLDCGLYVRLVAEHCR